MIRRLVATGSLVTALVAPQLAAAQEDAVQRANRMAYASAMKCYVANGHALAERRRAGDAASAALYDSKARKAFNLAVGLGQELGYDNDRIQQDLGLTQINELPEMVRNEAYFRSAVANCKALGLM